MFYKLHIYKCFDKYSSFFFSYKIDLKNSYSNLLDIHRIRRYIHFRFFKNNSYFLMLLGASEILILPIVMLCTGIYDIDLFYDNKFIWFYSYISSKLLSMILISLSMKVMKKHEIKMSKSELFITYLSLIHI